MKYLKIFTDFVQDMEYLDDAERGRLFVMMLKYAESGEYPSPIGNERYVWGTARKQIDLQRNAYNSKVSGAEKARSKRLKDSDINMIRSDINKINMESSQDTDKEKDKDKTKNKVKETATPPPTLEDIKNYCLERKNAVNAERFYDYYSERNWHKANGKPLVDWKKAVREWEVKDNRNKDRPKNYGSENYEQKVIRMEDLTNLLI